MIHAGCARRAPVMGLKTGAMITRPRVIGYANALRAHAIPRLTSTANRRPACPPRSVGELEDGYVRTDQGMVACPLAASAEGTPEVGRRRRTALGHLRRPRGPSRGDGALCPA